jgi:thiol-disulfide isomerase/thioredoxin
MALTESNMVSLGWNASPFTLLDVVSGGQKSFEVLKGKNGTVVMFICNHCPYVIHVNSELVKVANEYMVKGIGFIAINSNDVEKYTDDKPEYMRIAAMVLNYPFSYLFDATQEVAKAYDAACTPDIYLFDEEDKLFYRGRLDDSRPKSTTPLSGGDLRNALDAMLNVMPAPQIQHPSVGCNIKWK